MSKGLSYAKGLSLVEVHYIYYKFVFCHVRRTADTGPQLFISPIPSTCMLASIASTMRHISDVQHSYEAFYEGTASQRDVSTFLRFVCVPSDDEGTYGSAVGRAHFVSSCSYFHALPGFQRPEYPVSLHGLKTAARCLLGACGRR